MNPTPPDDAHHPRMKPHDPHIDLNEIAEILRNLMHDDLIMGAETPPRQNRPAHPESSAARPTPLASAAEDEIPLINDIPPEWAPPFPGEYVSGPFESLDELPTASNAATPEPASPHGNGTEEPPAKLIDGGPRTYGTEEMRDRAMRALSDMKRMSGHKERRPDPSFIPAALEPVPAPAPGTETEVNPAPIFSEAPPVSPHPAPQPAPPAMEEPSTQFTPRGSLRVRLDAYMEWVRTITQCTQILIADNQGYPLMKDQVDADNPLVASGLQLMSVLGSIRTRMHVTDNAGPGVYLPLSAEKWLCVLECEANGERICLCLVTHAPLSPEAATELTHYLVRALED